MDEFDDMSTINGKPVDATANLRMYVQLKECKAPIEKVFGVILKETNVLLKFHLIFSYTLSPGNEPREKCEFKLIYLSEDPIDCKIITSGSVRKKPQLLQNLTCGNQLYEKMTDFSDITIFGAKHTYIIVALSLKKKSQELSLLTQISNSFNDESSSDFIIECQEKEFHVHQYIIKQRSEYFAGLLRNNCMERENQRIVINDFEPKVVEILLRYLYNGAICLSTIKVKETMIGVIKIADKYNFTALVDAIDSYCATGYYFNLFVSPNPLSILRSAITIVDETLLPKLAMFMYLWKKSNESDISDEQWSKLIREYPSFAQRMANVSCRKDYQEWGRQHRSWFLYLEKFGENPDTPIIKTTDSAIIVGPLGEMKGAVKCSSGL
jgi:hypothetical protein